VFFRLLKKPGALRHGIPFQNWDLPEPIQQVRKQLLKQKQNDRAFVDCLLLAKDVGIDTFETACELTTYDVLAAKANREDFVYVPLSNNAVYVS
jgi:hypothetical protein